MMTPPWSLVCLAVTITAVSSQYLSDGGENEKRNDFSRDIMHFGKRAVIGPGGRVLAFGSSDPGFERDMMSFGKRATGFEREMMSFGKRSPLNCLPRTKSITCVSNTSPVMRSVDIPGRLLSNHPYRVDEFSGQR
ncbi:hypothetical protein Y032_0044g1071 [Ancylostoma ceylanicum]|nr:hypothetical protein Y032_0044g1071 [Ancylostoma ceylanicum]